MATAIAQRSIRLLGKTSAELARTGAQSGEIFYDTTNQTLRLSSSQSSVTLATREWVTANAPNVNLTGYATQTYVNTQINSLINSNAQTLAALEDITSALSDQTAQGAILAEIATKADTSALATVAFSGSYADLTNKPTIFNGNYNSLTNKPAIFSGRYSDLTDKPTIPNDTSQLSNGAGYAVLPSQTGNSGKVLSTNGTSTSWITLTGSGGAETDPVFLAHAAHNVTTTKISNWDTAYSWGNHASAGYLTGTISYTSLSNKPTLFSGSYADLTNKPTLFSGSYADLTNKPTIPSLTGYATESYVTTAVSNLVDAAPSTLDTLNELAAALGDDANYATTITTALGLKADTSSLATVATSGSYADLTNKPTIPTQYTDALARSALSAGTGISYNSSTGAISSSITQYTDALARSALSTAAGSGAYNSSTGVITIPTNTSHLTNGAGFITSTGIPSQSGNSGKYLTTDGTSVSWATVTSGTDYSTATEIKIGSDSGSVSQGTNGVAIGVEAGRTQGFRSVAIGWKAGYSQSGQYAVAVGANAGYSQTASSVILNAGGGVLADLGVAGFFVQPLRSAATTSYVLYFNTTTKEITFGAVPSGGGGSGTDYSTVSTIALGSSAGATNQTAYSIAIGAGAGGSNQGSSDLPAIAIGLNAGATSQSRQAIAIGYEAGYVGQGNAAIAIGYQAGYSYQASNSIVLNASFTNPTGSGQQSGFYVSPVRGAITTSNVVYYNNTSGEMTYGDAPSGGGGATTGWYSMIATTNGTTSLPVPTDYDATMTNMSSLKLFVGGEDSTNTSGNQPSTGNWMSNSGMGTFNTYNNNDYGGGYVGSTINFFNTSSGGVRFALAPNYTSSQSGNYNYMPNSSSGTAFNFYNGFMGPSPSGSNKAYYAILVLDTSGITATAVNCTVHETKSSGGKTYIAISMTDVNIMAANQYSDICTFSSYVTMRAYSFYNYSFDNSA